jgi:hypothetical protein
MKPSCPLRYLTVHLIKTKTVGKNPDEKKQADGEKYRENKKIEKLRTWISAR